MKNQNLNHQYFILLENKQFDQEFTISVIPNANDFHRSDGGWNIAIG